MRAGRVANESDALRIDPELAGLAAHELDCCFGVVDRARIGLHAWLHQAVLDGEHGNAVAGEVRSPVRVDLAVADLPAAAMNRDQHRRLGHALWRIEIADQFDAFSGSSADPP